MIYDIIFLSYLESNADKNWLELKKRFPRAKRVHGQKGIRQAHKRASELSDTLFFFLVDGDNRVRKDFQFECPIQNPKEDTLYVWRCYNPVNELVYGYGAIKLYNKVLLQKQLDNYTDFATSIAAHYHIIDQIASDTYFYDKPEEAWRGAFRECAKLTKQILIDKNDKQASQRLNQWLTRSTNSKNSTWVAMGAASGHDYALQCENDDFNLLNDFDWLNKRYINELTTQQNNLDQKKREASTKQEDLYKVIEQVFLGLEVLCPQHIILKRIRYFLEKYLLSNRDEILVNDFFEIIKEINHYPVTSTLSKIENTTNFEQYKAVLKSDSYFYYETEDISKKELPLLKKIEIISETKDEKQKVHNYLELYIELYQDPILLLLNKALNHLTKLHSDLPLWTFLYEVTKDKVYHRVKVIRQDYPKFRTHESFAKNQVLSKLWLAEELQKVSPNKPNVLITCGWSGLLPYIINDKLPYKTFVKIRSIDINNEATLVANCLNAEAVKDNYSFKAATADAYQVNYVETQLTLVNSKGISDQELYHYDILINTSCEHLKDFKQWYDKIPEGKKIVLQSNNYFDCPEHNNCVASLEDFMTMAPMNHYDFKGALKFNLYTRFMLIGQK